MRISLPLYTAKGKDWMSKLRLALRAYLTPEGCISHGDFILATVTNAHFEKG
jgi:hypothetical protein